MNYILHVSAKLIQEGRAVTKSKLFADVICQCPHKGGILSCVIAHLNIQYQPVHATSTAIQKPRSKIQTRMHAAGGEGRGREDRKQYIGLQRLGSAPKGGRVSSRRSKQSVRPSRKPRKPLILTTFPPFLKITSDDDDDSPIHVRRPG